MYRVQSTVYGRVLLFDCGLFALSKQVETKFLRCSTQQIPDIETVVFHFRLHLRGTLKEGAQAAVLCPLRLCVAGRHIRGKEHIAQQGIERGKGVLLFCRQLAVFLPEEEHIRVAAIGTAIELPPE